MGAHVLRAQSVSSMSSMNSIDSMSSHSDLELPDNLLESLDLSLLNRSGSSHSGGRRQLAVEQQYLLAALPVTYTCMARGAHGAMTAARVAGKLHHVLAADLRFWKAAGVCMQVVCGCVRMCADALPCASL